jgi:hypothetical protein
MTDFEQPGAVVALLPQSAKMNVQRFRLKQIERKQQKKHLNKIMDRNLKHNSLLDRIDFVTE